MKNKFGKCAVCGHNAITRRNISINNAPKEVLSVCEIHADAADENDEAQRRDEKNGLYGGEINIAN